MTQNEINLYAYLRSGGRSVNGYFKNIHEKYKSIDICPFCGKHGVAKYRPFPAFLIKCEECGIHDENEIIDYNRKIFPKFITESGEISDMRERFTGLSEEAFQDWCKRYARIERHLDERCGKMIRPNHEIQKK